MVALPLCCTPRAVVADAVPLKVIPSHSEPQHALLSRAARRRIRRRRPHSLLNVTDFVTRTELATLLATQMQTQNLLATQMQIVWQALSCTPVMPPGEWFEDPPRTPAPPASRVQEAPRWTTTPPPASPRCCPLPPAPRAEPTRRVTLADNVEVVHFVPDEPTPEPPVGLLQSTQDGGTHTPGPRADEGTDMSQWQALARVPVKRYAFTRVSPSLSRTTPRWDSVYPGHWSIHERNEGVEGWGTLHRDYYKRVGVDTGERFWMFERDQELYAAYGKEQVLMSRHVQSDDDVSDHSTSSADEPIVTWWALFADFELRISGEGRHDMDRIDVTLVPHVPEGTPVEYDDVRGLIGRRILDARL